MDNDDQFKYDGILGDEFLHDSNSLLSSGKNTMTIENTEIDFTPIAKKTSLEFIHEERKQYSNNSLSKHDKIPEISINIISEQKIFVDNPTLMNSNFNIKQRLEKIEKNLLKVRESLEIKNKLINLEKQIELLNKNILSSTTNVEQEVP